MKQRNCTTLKNKMVRSVCIASDPVWTYKYGQLQITKKESWTKSNGNKNDRKLTLRDKMRNVRVRQKNKRSI